MLKDLDNAKTETAHRLGRRSLHKQHHLVLVHNLEMSTNFVFSYLIDEFENFLGILVLHLALGLEVVVRLVHVASGKKCTGISSGALQQLRGKLQGSKGTKHKKRMSKSRSLALSSRVGADARG